MTEGQCQKGHEDGGEAPWGKTQAVTEGQCQKGHEDGGEAPWGKTQAVTEGQCQKGHEDGGEAPWGKTQAVTEGQCQEGHENGGKRPGGRLRLRWKDTVRRDLKAWNNGPLTGEMERSLQDPLPRTGRQWRKVSRVRPDSCVEVNLSCSDI